MINKYLAIQLVLPLFFFSSVMCAFGIERQSRYARLVYANKELLKEFNEELYLGRSLTRMLNKRKIVTVEDEAIAKIDIIIEKAQVVLDMFPNNMQIGVVLLADEDDVARIYKKKYGRSANHIAYYSLSEDTIYLSVDDVNLEVFSHEVGHAVVDHFFKVRPPYNIHELMAQFTAKHISD